MVIINKLLTNAVARPKQYLNPKDVKAIVIHYPANPKQVALDVIKYWNGEKGQVGSAHYVVDLNGDVYCAIPDNEKAYHVGSSTVDPASGKVYTDLAREIFGDYAKNPLTMSPNRCSIGIEMCHTDWNGEMTPETIESTVELAAFLCKKFNLDPEKAILTHKDVVGWKDCHIYYIKHPEEFAAFKKAVKERLNGLA